MDFYEIVPLLTSVHRMPLPGRIVRNISIDSKHDNDEVGRESRCLHPDTAPVVGRRSMSMKDDRQPRK